MKDVNIKISENLSILVENGELFIVGAADEVYVDEDNDGRSMLLIRDGDIEGLIGQLKQLSI
jgi:hypothetical protein